MTISSGDDNLPRVSRVQQTKEPLILDLAVPVRGNYRTSTYTLAPRLEILVFEGLKPRWWIHRCERFFQFYNVVEGWKNQFGDNLS